MKVVGLTVFWTIHLILQNVFIIISRSHNGKFKVLMTATYSLSWIVIHDCVPLLF